VTRHAATRRLVIGALLVAVLAGAMVTPVSAQGIPVFDIRAIRNLISIVREAQRMVDLARQGFTIIKKMSKPMEGLARYRMPELQSSGHDITRWKHGWPWLLGLNTGDARGLGYFATVQPIQRDLDVLDRLPPEAQRKIKAAYATIEIFDSINMMGGHQVAAIRGYYGRLNESIRMLESDITSSRPELQDMTARLDLIAVAESVGLKQSMAGNQLDDHILEQLLAQNKAKRDDAASNINMRLNGIRERGAMDRSLVADGEYLTTWSQP
jgi:hypothetical protein